MAIGARGRDVLLQFLVEAVVVSLFGGGIGIALGVGLSQGVRSGRAGRPQCPLTPSPSRSPAAVIGVFFGFYPARNAARSSHRRAAI
jgi:putative ABC transport system permease protein